MVENTAKTVSNTIHEHDHVIHLDWRCADLSFELAFKLLQLQILLLQISGPQIYDIISGEHPFGRFATQQRLVFTALGRVLHILGGKSVIAVRRCRKRSDEAMPSDTDALISARAKSHRVIIYSLWVSDN